MVLLSSPYPNSVLKLLFTEFDTESGNDVVTLREGSSSGTGLGSLSGASLPATRYTSTSTVGVGFVDGRHTSLNNVFLCIHAEV
jgi:hypothetical protein